jgi:cytochrome c oxidase assembly protein subunit 15
MTKSLNVFSAKQVLQGWSAQINSKFMGYYALTLAVITFGLMALGSATRVMDAGLACPDWPLCFGAVIPAEQMDVQVFLEWFHRVVASVVGFLTLGMAVLAWWRRSTLPAWLPWASLGAVALVITQGILGGLTVTRFLQFEIVTAHLGTGLAFFSYLLVVGWKCLMHEANQIYPLTVVGSISAVLVYGQSLLGGVVASRWAVHQCLDSQEFCGVVANHLWGIIPASLGMIVVAIVAWRRFTLGSVGVLLLWLLQLSIGYSTYKLQLSVPALTVMHQAVGALLLGSLITLTTLSTRSPRLE